MASTFLSDYTSGKGTISGNPTDPNSLAKAAKVNQSYDYNDIMGGYDNILNDVRNKGSQGSNTTGFVPISPTFSQYKPVSYNRSAGLDSVVSGLNSYASNGGYSDEDLSAIRERGLSPLRSVYSNAQDNVRRKNVLAGGTASNYGAVTAKMARELGYQLSDQSTKINANIADMLAKNKLSAMQTLAPLMAQENSISANTTANNAAGERDNERYNNEETNRVNEENLRIAEMNRESENNFVNNQLKALSGKTQLYSSNPQLAQTFSNDAFRSQQLNTAANAIKSQRTPGFAGVTLPGRR
jgi:hypothetical protein